MADGDDCQMIHTELLRSQSFQPLLVQEFERSFNLHRWELSKFWLSHTDLTV